VWVKSIFENENISVEVEVLWVVLWGWELWINLMDEFIVVFTVDHEIEDWLEISLHHGGEVEMNQMPGVEHGWRVSWVNHWLIEKMKCLGSGHDEFSLVLNDRLVLVLLSDLHPMLLNGVHLIGLSDGSHVLSEGNDLFDLVASVVLHLSELVVLLVEVDPGIIIEIDLQSVMWRFSVFFCISGLLENHVSFLDSVELSQVLFVEHLDLIRWTLFLESLDKMNKGLEFLGLDKSMGLSLELLSMVARLHHMVVLHGFMLEGLSLGFEWLDLLLFQGNGEEFGSLLVLLHGGSGGDSGNSGELEHFFLKSIF